MKSFLALLISSFSALAIAGDHVGNGGGLAERNIVLAHQQIESYISLCLNAEACKLSARERDLLTKIVNAMPTERKSPQIAFASEKESPGMFMIDGEVRIAKTGDAVGDVIYFNRDMIYTKDVAGDTVAMSLAEAVSHWVHELGHHQGVYEHTELDLAGTKVSLQLQNHMQIAPFLPLENILRAVVLNKRTNSTSPQIIFYAFGEVIEMTGEFERATKCWGFIPTDEDPNRLVLAKDGGGAKPLSIVFHNIYWEEHKLGRKKGHFVLKGNVTTQCKADKKADYNSNAYKASIRFEVEKVKDKDGKEYWRVERDSFEVRQHYEPWWKIINLPTLF